MSDKQDTREMLVSGNVFKTMLTLSVPAVLGMVVIGLYNFMDAVFVGQQESQGLELRVCSMHSYLQILQYSYLQ